VLIRKMTFNVTQVGALSDVSGFQLFGPSGAVNANGVSTTTASETDASTETRLPIVFDDANADRLVPAGTSKTYTLKASTVSGLSSANVESLSIRLLADTSFATTSVDSDRRTHSVGVIETSASTTDRFIWSPNSTTTPEATAAKNDNLDWVNSYGLPGFPGVGQDHTTRTFSH